MLWNFKKAFPVIFVWLWSTGFIAAKYGLPYIEPYFMLTVRFSCVIVIVYFLALIFRERSLSANESVLQFLVGILLHGIYLGGVFYAIKSGLPAGVAAIIVGLQPIVTSLFAYVWLNQRLQAMQIIGLMIGFLGVFLVIVGKDSLNGGGFNYVGLMACSIALLGISAGSVIQKKMKDDMPLLKGASFQYLGAFCIVGGMTFMTETQQVTIALPLVLSMAWLIFALSISALLLLMTVIRMGEITKVASYFYLVPPVTVLQAWLLFDERLGSLSIIGCCMALLGVYCVITPPKNMRNLLSRLRFQSRKDG